MGGYLGRRLLLAVPTLLGLSFITFLLGSMAGDPAGRLAERGLEPGEVPSAEQIAAVREELGLNDPVLNRYGRWLGSAAQGDFGESLITGEGVSHVIREAFPMTFGLAVGTIAVIICMSLPLGLLGALFNGRRLDQMLRVMALFGASVPAFFLSYVLVFVFAVKLRALPVAGTQGLKSLVLPSFALAAGPAALVSRLLQTTLLEVLGEEYIRAARARGLAAIPVLVLHALRNAALPVVTVLGSILARLIEGAVVIELIFARPGIGQLTLTAIGNSDYPMVQGVVLFAGAVFIVFNLLVDLSYSVVDPRVRLGHSS